MDIKGKIEQKEQQRAIMNECKGIKSELETKQYIRQYS